MRAPVDRQCDGRTRAGSRPPHGPNPKQGVGSASRIPTGAGVQGSEAMRATRSPSPPRAADLGGASRQEGTKARGGTRPRCDPTRGTRPCAGARRPSSGAAPAWASAAPPARAPAWTALAPDRPRARSRRRESHRRGHRESADRGALHGTPPRWARPQSLRGIRGRRQVRSRTDANAGRLRRNPCSANTRARTGRMCCARDRRPIDSPSWR